MSEEELQKYIILRSELQAIKTNTESLESDKNKLISLLNNSFKINNKIIEKEKFEEISNNINEAKDSINQVIKVCNNKI